MNLFSPFQKMTIPLGCLSFLISCSDAGPAQAPVHPPETDIIAPDTVSIVPEKNPYEDSLRNYFANPVDFYTLKKQTQHMHSGGMMELPDKYFHTVNDPDAILYHYWAIEFIKPKYSDQYALNFATWKPWKTKAQRSYEADNETLVGIRCGVKWEGLGASDFVGLSMDAVKTRFGEPQAIDDRHSVYYNTANPNGPKDKVRPTYVYYLDDHVLLLHEQDKKIAWFKYYWWHEPVVADSLPETVFSWTER